MRAVVNGTLEPGSVIENLIEADPDLELPGKTLVDAGDAGIGWVWDGEAWQPPAATAPSPTEVDAERDRRIANGFTFNGVRFQSRPEDRENIAGAALAALKAMVNGKGEGELDWFPGVPAFAWIAEDNSTVAMDAPTMFAFGDAAAAHKQALIFKARAIKDMDPIPVDYADDGYWT